MEEKCKAKGIGGNLSWPVSLSCDLDKDHKEEDHNDPIRGKWRMKK